MRLMRNKRILVGKRLGSLFRCSNKNWSTQMIFRTTSVARMKCFKKVMNWFMVEKALELGTVHEAKT